MTKEEYLKKYGGNIKATPMTLDEKLKSIFGDTLESEVVRPGQYDYVQQPQTVYNRPVTQQPQVQQQTQPLQQPVGRMPEVKEQDPFSSAYDWSKQQNVVLPAAGNKATPTPQEQVFSGQRFAQGNTAGATPEMMLGEEVARREFRAKPIDQSGWLGVSEKPALITRALNAPSVKKALQEYNKYTTLPEYIDALKVRGGEGVITRSIKGLPQVIVDIIGASFLSSVTKSPNVGKLYFGLRSAGGQAQEGRVSPEKIGIDVALDSRIGGFIEKLLGGSSGAIKKEIAAIVREGGGSTSKLLGGISKDVIKGVTVEGLTEPTQDLLSFSVDYKNARTPAEKAAVVNSVKNYFLDGDFAVSLLTGGIAGGLATGAVSTAVRRGEVRQAQEAATQLPSPEQQLALPEGATQQQRPLITPNTAQRPTIELPQQVGLQELPSGRKTGTAQTAPSNVGFTMRGEGKTKKGVEPTVTYGPIIKAGDFDTVVATISEIKKKTPEIVSELVKTGESKESAKEIVANVITVLRQPETLDNGTTQQVEQESGLDKIAATGVVKNIETRNVVESQANKKIQPVVATKEVKNQKEVVDVQDINNKISQLKKAISKEPEGRWAKAYSREVKKLERLLTEKKAHTAIIQKNIAETTPTEKNEIAPVEETEEQKKERALRERAEGINKIKRLQKEAKEKAEAKKKIEKEKAKEPKAKSEVKSTVEKADKIYKEYLALVKDPDYDLDTAMEIATRYEELTGKNIEYHEEFTPTAVDTASTERTEISEGFDMDKELDEMERNRGGFQRFFRRFKGKPTTKQQIGQESTERTSKMQNKIEDINSGKVNFSLANEALRIARRFGVRIMKNLPGVEGHSVKNFIGLDSLNNPITLAHEITHSIVYSDREIIRRIISDEGLIKETTEAYNKYYPGAVKDKTASMSDMINEGFAEFISQSLYNPTKTSIEFPGLHRIFLGTKGAAVGGEGRFGRNSIDKIRDLYAEVNNLLYTYQNINETAQLVSKQVNKIDVTERKYGSIILGSIGTRIVNYLNSRHIFSVIDSLAQGADETKNFTEGVSTNMRAATFRKSMKIASKTFDEDADAVYMMSKDGKTIEKKLGFGIGNWLRKIFDNENRSRIFGVYLSALDSQRDRRFLSTQKEKLKSLQFDLEFAEKKTSIAKISASIEAVKQEILELEARVDSKATTDEQEKRLISENTNEFADDLSKFNQIITLNSNLQVESGAISADVAEEAGSRPGYSQQFRFMIDEMEGFRGNEKRSAQMATIKGRRASVKPVINPALTISKVFIDNVKKYHTQLFYNDLYKKGMAHGFVVEVGEGTVNEPGVYVYAEGGKLTRFKVLDDLVTTAVEADFGSQEIKSPTWRFIHGWLLRRPTRFAQKLTTSLSPYFVFGKNIFIDTAISSVFSKTGYKPLYSQVQRGLGLGIYKNRKEDIERYTEEYSLFNDAQVTTTELGYDGVDPFQAAEALLKRKGVVSKVYGKFLDIMSATETFVRQEEYIRARLQGDGVAEASEKADNISLNYSQRGAKMKLANQSVMFLNSSTRAMYQMLGAMKDKKMAKRLGVAIIVTSALQVAAIAKMIYDAEDEEDKDKKEDKIQEIYKYLDKSTYEKVSYIPLPRGYKLPSNSFLSWPGVIIGHILMDDFMGTRTNKKEIAYQGVSSLIPNQILPDFISGKPIASGFGKLIGSTVVGNVISNLSGYKTFPEFKQVESDTMKYDKTSQRFADGTNRLAIILGQMVENVPGLKDISPVEFEAALRSGTGSMGITLTDIAGELAMSDDDKEILNIEPKEWNELLIKNPLKSSFVQAQSVLQGELVSPIYDKRSELDSKKQNLISEYNKLLRGEGIRDPKKIEDVDGVWLAGKLHGDAFGKSKEILKEKAEVDKQLRDINKITDAIIVAKKYKRELPPVYTSALYRYAILAKNGEENKIAPVDMNRIKELSSEYKDLGDGSPKTYWRFK